MTETAEDEAPCTALEEISIKGLCNSVAEALAKQVGGQFEVQLRKLERTHPGHLDDRLILEFCVEDQSWFSRIRREDSE